MAELRKAILRICLPTSLLFIFLRTFPKERSTTKRFAWQTLRRSFSSRLLQGIQIIRNERGSLKEILRKAERQRLFFNERVFVINSAVKSFRSLEDEMSQKTSGDEYQCLMPETRGKLLMVTDEERILLRVVLSKVMETEGGREYIVERLGEPNLQIAADLLKEMESDWKSPYS
jgi:hypothetical protein